MSSKVFTNFTPNHRWSDVKQVCKFFLPWYWSSLRSGIQSRKVEKWFCNFLDKDYSYCFDSGRSSLYLTLQAMGIGKGDEVILPGYTCIVVSNAIKRLGAKPVYVDVEENLNLDPDMIEDKISPKTQAIVVQHTFGLPVPVKQVKNIINEYDLYLVEDCAHALGGMYNNRRLGSYGDVSIFSFGVDKIISSVRGGIAVTDNSEFAEKLNQKKQQLKQISYLELFKHLIYYPIFWFGKRFYHIKIGKLVLYLANKMNILADIMSSTEKKGEVSKIFPTNLANSLAKLAKKQLHYLKKNTQHRRHIAQVYEQKLPDKIKVQEFNYSRTFLKYPIKVKNKEKLLNLAKKRGFFLGKNWSGSNIVPSDSAREEVDYEPGSCSNAERIASNLVLLPVSITISDKQARELADFIVKLIKRNTINYVQG